MLCVCACVCVCVWLCVCLSVCVCVATLVIFWAYVSACITAVRLCVAASASNDIWHVSIESAHSSSNCSQQ